MTPARDDPSLRKARLYCPDCGHESPIGGDWRVRHAAAVELYCPDCETLVTDRSLDGVSTESGRDRPVTTV